MRWPTLALCSSVLWLLARLPTSTSAGSSIFKVAKIGDNVTMECFFGSGSVAVMFYWYKQVLGQKPIVISRFYKHDKNSTFIGDFQKDPRLSLINQQYQNHLTISNLRLTDSASYYCISGYAYMYKFEESVMLVVTSEDFNVETQTNRKIDERVKLGSDVVVQCLVNLKDCDGQREVYWFRAAENENAEVIFRHGRGSEEDKCVNNGKGKTNTCVYNLYINNVRPEQTGTYYCAVAACGQVQFGDGTTVQLEEVQIPVLVYVLSGALAFTVLLAVLLCVSALRMIRTTRTRSASVTSGSQSASDEVHYASVRPKQCVRSRVQTQRDDTWSECVYSEVRQ
ncbi:hypothetical protein WMY93_017278 [Mugilogobius chulae]|uniref:Ig-like domain-containing protein n=1 Tax=Mugilogobius chulae TaxID=88201 RepID=A0AAW0NUU5_9GOBI